MNLLTPLMISALLVSGMVAALLGSIKLPLARRLEIDEARVGGLVSVFGFIMIPVIFLAGFLTDQVGKQAVLMSGSVLLAVSLVLLAASRRYPLALTSVVLLGGAWAMFINVGNVLTPYAFPGSLSRATNLANVFFGMGAFLTPLAVALLVRQFSLPAALLLLGGVTLIPAALAAGVDFTALVSSSDSAAPGQLGIGTLLSDPILWLCGLALFFYGPLEASLGAWATTYLGEQGVSEGKASGLLSGFWLTFMAARLLTAFTLEPGQETLFIFGLGVASTAVLLGMVFTRQRTAAMALVLLAGLVFGPVFPTLLAVLFRHFDPSLHGRAVGLLFAIGGVGWTAIPILIGAYARRTSVQRGFAVAVGAAIGLSTVGWLLHLAR